MIGLAGALAVGLGRAPAARAQESRYAVVDISPGSRNEKVAADVESQVARLRAGARPLEDASMRRLLATGEGPIAAANRLTREAEERRTAGDCEAAAERARAAEALTLTSVPLDDERELLRTQYVVLVACEHQRGRAAERDAAAFRLRSLVSLAPSSLPPELWDKYVNKAVPPAATTELHVDSDPANAQIQINFHGDGVTPRTLKVPRGTVYIEVQKDGYLKAFRKVEVAGTPARTAFRLVERTHDRLDQALAASNVLRRTDPGQAPSAPTLARLAQLARADLLVVMSMLAPDTVKIWFFDADRGALSSNSITSPVDPSTGRVTALADRSGKSSAADAPLPATGTPGKPSPPAPAGAQGTPAAGAPAPSSAGGDGLQKLAAPRQGLPEAQTKQAPPVTHRRTRAAAPWWSWLIAGAIGAGLLTFVYLDRPQRQDTLAVRAFWTP
jgi:PEGA domain